MFLLDTKHQLGIEGLNTPARQYLVSSSWFTLKPPPITSPRVMAFSLLKWLESVQRTSGQDLTRSELLRTSLGSLNECL